MIPINVNGFSLLYYYYYYIIDVILNNIFTNKLRRIRGFILYSIVSYSFFVIWELIAIRIKDLDIFIYFF